MNYMAAICLFLLISLSGCGSLSAPRTVESSLTTVAFSRWGKTTLMTCWEFTSKTTSVFRTEVTNHVTRAFQNSVVQFVGWEQCSAEKTADVKIFVYDDAGSFRNKDYQSFVKSLIAENGSQKQGAGHPRLRDLNRPMRLVLNQTFKDADPGFRELYARLNAQGKKNIALTAAIHELGHALGLRHEDAHPERTCDDFAEQPGDMPGELLVVSAYNPFSFMSRCYYRTFNYNLSVVYPNAKDIEGINLLYAVAVK